MEVASALEPFSDVARKLWGPFTLNTELFPNTRAEFEGNLKPLTDLECTGEPPLCTDLLIDPVGVLSDRTRWPSHFWTSTGPTPSQR